MLSHTHVHNPPNTTQTGTIRHDDMNMYTPSATFLIFVVPNKEETWVVATTMQLIIETTNTPTPSKPS